MTLAGTAAASIGIEATAKQAEPIMKNHEIHSVSRILDAGCAPLASG